MITTQQIEARKRIGLWLMTQIAELEREAQAAGEQSSRTSDNYLEEKDTKTQAA